MKNTIILVICFVAGVIAGQFLPFTNNPTVAQNSGQPELAARLDHLEGLILALSDSVTNQPTRVYHASAGSKNTSPSDSLTADDIAEIVRREVNNQAQAPTPGKTMEPESYESVNTFVASQIESGFWTAESAEQLGAAMVDMSPAQRSEIQLKLIQALNAGEVTLEDPSQLLY